MADLLRATADGLYCEAGGFHIDPWRPVDRAVITHAHSDHASPGSSRYLCAQPGAQLARHRLGSEATIETLAYGQPASLGDVTLTFHPAGHVLGSAQVLIQSDSERWVFSGDYKLAPDPTCQPFEPVQCDVFITEATFALPIYRWSDPQLAIDEIHQWWRANQDDNRTSVLYAYSLGKSQRLLALLDASIGPIYVHGALLPYIEAYRAAGVALPEVKRAIAADVKKENGRALVVAPPMTTNDFFLRKLGPISQAQASGWMRVRGRRRWQSFDRGFVISDHADWPGLLGTIEATGASRIGVTHGFTAPLARYLQENGRESFVLPTRYTGEQETEITAPAEEAPS